MRVCISIKSIKVCSENENIVNREENREMWWNSPSHKTHWQHFVQLCKINSLYSGRDFSKQGDVAYLTNMLPTLVRTAEDKYSYKG